MLVKGSARLCKMPIFWRFLCVQSGDQILDEEAAAAYVRDYCGVTSRAELATNGQAANRFGALVKKFNAFLKAER